MPTPPECFECHFEGGGFPCRRNGNFNVDHLAAAYVAAMPEKERASQEIDGLHWTVNCVFELEHEHPELCLEVVLASLKLVKTSFQAGYLAAGPLEQIIADHGERVIEGVETMARQSRRFRYLLTGVWPQGNDDNQVWQRVLKARGWASHEYHTQDSGVGLLITPFPSLISSPTNSANKR